MLLLHVLVCVCSTLVSKVPCVETASLGMQGNAYDDDEEYGDVDDGGDEGALY